MKKISLFLIILLCNNLFSFGSKEVPVDVKSKISVGLILDSTGLGDQMGNDSSYLGLERAAQEGLITLRTLNLSDETDFTTLVEDFKKYGVNFIYAIGEDNKANLISEAKKNPTIQFIGIDILFKDSELKPNLSGITFKEQEGGYLAGLLAGSMTYKYHKRYPTLNKTNKVGVIIGKSTPSTKRYELGFFAGVKEVNPPCEVITVNINDLNSPEKGAKAVKDLKKKGVDIIFSVAGESEEGIFQEAKEQNILVIGSNKDRFHESDIVLTSVMKELSVSSYLLTKNLITGEIEGGANTYFGVCEKALYLSSFYTYDKFIPREIKVLIRKSCDKLSSNSDMLPATKAEVEFNIEDVPEIEE